MCTHPAVDRKRICVTLCVVALLTSVSVSAQEEMVRRTGPNGVTMVPLSQATPESANPYLALLPEGVEPDYDYWDAHMRQAARDRRGGLPALTSLIPVTESEPNNTTGTANAIPGFGTGAGDDPSANVTGSIAGGDVDFFSFDLDAGDVFGANVIGTGSAVALFDPSGTLRVSRSNDVSGIFPASSPLPGGGNASIAYVAEVAGTWTARVAGTAGAYTAELRVFRPGLETAGGTQTLFVDFDGATINSNVFGGANANRVLSPLSAFLPGWGLAPGDLDAVVDSILAAITETVETDLAAFGLNPLFGVTILNSRDHADPFGNPNVSRLIVGGTIAQLGINTIGIAQSIDPGNFNTQESAVTLLDLLSTVGTNPNSLNQFALNPPATIIDLIGQGVGNITAHEAGHYLGNFHTNQFNAVPNIMDQGGNLPNSVGVGADLIFGTADDVDVDFVVDAYVANEGFTGIEDTRNTTAFGLPSTPPANDECDDAICLFDGEIFIGSTEGATGDVLATCGTENEPATDVWHSYIPNDDAVVTVSLCGPATNFDTILSIFDACNGTEFACNDDTCDGPSEVSLAMTAGVEYLIRVAGFAGATGTYEILITGGNGTCGLAKPLNEDVESGAAGFTSSGLWHQTTSCPAPLDGHSAETIFYYGVSAGNQCTYSTGVTNTGTLTSPAIDLTEATDGVLMFNYFLQTEQFAGFDVATVAIDPDGTGPVPVAANVSGAGASLVDGSGVWQEIQIDLSPFIGSSIQILFIFDTVDGISNAFTGFAVDDIMVLADLPSPPEGCPLFIEDGVAAPGEIVSVTVSLDGALNNLNELDFDVTFDPTNLGFFGVELGDLTSGWNFVLENDAPGNIHVDGSTAGDAIPQGASGSILRVLFQSAPVVPGTTEEFCLENLAEDLDAWPNSEDCCGTVEFAACRDGDVDNSNAVTPGDALAAFQHFLQQASLPICRQYHADVISPTVPPSVTPGDALEIFNCFLAGGNCTIFPKDCSGGFCLELSPI